MTYIYTPLSKKAKMSDDEKHSDSEDWPPTSPYSGSHSAHHSPFDEEDPQVALEEERYYGTVSPISPSMLQKVARDSYYKGLEKWMINFYYKYFDDFYKTHGTLPFTIPDPIQQRALQSMVSKITTKSKYMMVTVNPKPGIELPEFKKKIEKFVGRSMVQKYAYVYEVRNYEEKEFSGLHSHILLEYDGTPSNFKRNTKNTFKKICDVNNSHILNFKFVPIEHLPDKMNYLKGIKQKKKLPSVEITKKFREKNELKTIYQSEPPLPL